MDRTFTGIKKLVLPILKRHGIRKASIFGSVARGDSNKKSDLDLLVEFKETPSLLEIGSLYNDLKGELGVRPDIVTYASINKRLRPFIMKDKIDIL